MPIPTMPGRRKPRRRQTYKINKEEHYVIPKRSINTVTLNSDSTDIARATKYISGSRWDVKKYYLTLRAESDLVSNLDEEVSNDIQQYVEIDNVELRVITPLDIAKPEEVTGTAYLIGNIKPNIGDMFLATLAGNRETLMKVTNVDYNTYNNKKVYVIEYKIDTFLDVDSNRYNDLLTKVVRKYYFDHNYDMTESSPILVEDDYIYKKRLEKTLEGLYRYYIDIALDKEKKMFIIPQLQSKVVDPYLESFVLKILPFNNYNILNVTRITNAIDISSSQNIYSVMMNKELDYLDSIKRKFFLYTKTGLKLSPMITRVVLEQSLDPINASKIPDNTLPNRLVDDISYLFTENFYINPNDPNLSTIEKLIYQFMSDEIVDKDMLDILINTYKYWSRYDKYYYIPLLIVLIKDRIYKFHSNIGV